MIIVAITNFIKHMYYNYFIIPGVIICIVGLIAAGYSFVTNYKKELHKK